MKIPIEIQNIKDPDNVYRYRATVSLEDALSAKVSPQKLVEIQQRYAVFIENCKNYLQAIQANKRNRGDPVLKWMLADAIYRFIKDLEAEGYSFVNATATLARDLGISRRSINYLIEFRITYPERQLIRKEISWDKYKELLDIPNLSLRKKCTEKIVTGELKTRDDIRRFKKKLGIHRTDPTFL